MTTIPWLADALRDEGCRVVEEGDWEHRGRPGSFEPTGVLWHHTGSTASESNPFPTKSVLINGRPDLEGPLCHVGIGYDGVCHVIAAGRANHAGACSGWGPFTSSEDGNTQLVGFEIDYDGTQAMSAAQFDAATRCSAAVLKRLGHDEEWAARHEETSTTGKWDTGGVTGEELRGAIRSYLAGEDQGEPMPTYVRVRHEAGLDLKAATWTSIKWDTENVDPTGRVSGADLWLGDRAYALTVLATVDVDGTTDTLRTRTVEVDYQSKEQLSSDPQLEHPVTTGGVTRVGDARTGTVPTGRALRFQIYSPVAAHLDTADLAILAWP